MDPELTAEQVAVIRAEIFKRREERAARRAGRLVKSIAERQQEYAERLDVLAHHAAEEASEAYEKRHALEAMVEEQKRLYRERGII